MDRRPRPRPPGLGGGRDLPDRRDRRHHRPPRAPAARPGAGPARGRRAGPDRRPGDAGGAPRRAPAAGPVCGGAWRSRWRWRSSPPARTTSSPAICSPPWCRCSSRWRSASRCAGRAGPAWRSARPCSPTRSASASWASVSPALQRPDWEAVAEKLGEPARPRAIVSWTLGQASLRHYLGTHSFQVVQSERYPWFVHEIDFVSIGPAPPVPRATAGARLPPGRIRAGRPALPAQVRAAGPRPHASAAAPGARARISTSAVTASSSTGSGRAGSARLVCRRLSWAVDPLTHRRRGMAKTTKATQTADRAADIYAAARENPYVQRLIEDDELRDSLRHAFEAARGAYGRATGNGKGPVKAVTSDRKVQKDLREAAESLRDASEQLRAPRKRKKHRLRKTDPARRRRRGGRDRAQRGRPQDRARRPLRRRRGVRVHEQHQHQRGVGTSWRRRQKSVS